MAVVAGVAGVVLMSGVPGPGGMVGVGASRVVIGPVDNHRRSGWIAVVCPTCVNATSSSIRTWLSASL